MKLNVNFNHLESTPSINAKIEQKSEKLKKYFEGNFEVNWTCSADKSGHHSHVTVAGDRFVINADSVQDDLYKTFDDVIQKLERQLEKRKSQVKDHIHRKKESLPLN